jgi:hypothetical protein
VAKTALYAIESGAHFDRERVDLRIDPRDGRFCPRAATYWRDAALGDPLSKACKMAAQSRTGV